MYMRQWMLLRIVMHWRVNSKTITKPKIDKPGEFWVKLWATKISKLQTEVYDSQINLYVKEERILKSAAISIDDVTWR